MTSYYSNIDMLQILKYNILKENACLSKSMHICLAGSIIFIKFMRQFQSNFIIFMALTHGQLTHQTAERTVAHLLNTVVNVGSVL